MPYLGVTDDEIEAAMNTAWPERECAACGKLRGRRPGECPGECDYCDGCAEHKCGSCGCRVCERHAHHFDAEAMQGMDPKRDNGVRCGSCCDAQCGGAQCREDLASFIGGW